ncbi:MAG: tRNA (adenosine(37)-N6)-threonylcarbamoyltransferase complex ATPase subunit type 1 TsaE [Bacteroidota bacterium]
MAAQLHGAVTHSEDETRTLARSWADEVLKPGMIVALKGDLGAGKTHFVKGAAEALGIDPHSVSSPTYTLINEYMSSMPVYHFDLYRLEHEEEVWEIGAQEYFNAEGVCFVEWPDRIPGLLPEHTLWITIEKGSGTTRRFIVEDPHSGKDK